MPNTNHDSEGQRTWAEAWDLALDHRGLMYQLLYKYVRTHSLPWYRGEDLQKELESYAWESFFEACRKWDESKSKLSVYVYPSVINAMNARMKVLERMGTSLQGHYAKGTGPLATGGKRPELSSIQQLDERFAARMMDREEGERSLADIYRQPWQGEEPSLEDTVIDAVDQAATLDRIKSIVDKMSEPHKQVITLMYFTPPTHDRVLKGKAMGLGSGYTLSEVAKHFRRSTNWAKETLDEALDYIRFQLEAQGGNGE